MGLISGDELLDFVSRLLSVTVSVVFPIVADDELLEMVSGRCSVVVVDTRIFLSELLSLLLLAEVNVAMPEVVCFNFVKSEGCVPFIGGDSL